MSIKFAFAGVLHQQNIVQNDVGEKHQHRRNKKGLLRKNSKMLFSIGLCPHKPKSSGMIQVGEDTIPIQKKN